MEKWAESYHQNVQFLCVCVESKNVALAFHHNFGFNYVVNSYIPSRGYMPHGYGQLGCSGFVISDEDGYFITRKSSAFLQYGEEAFRDVERILSKYMVKNVTVAPSQTVVKAAFLTDETVRKAQEEKKSDVSDRTVQSVPSVGVDSMDHEHEECTNAFNNVMKDPSLFNLKQLFTILQSHFTHEEALMSQYSDKNNSGSFSSTKSHKMDHDRILQIAQNE